jgi:hypothetical protein
MVPSSKPIGTGLAPATSVHVYAPPLRSMAYYRPADDGTLVVHGVDDGGWEEA